MSYSSGVFRLSFLIEKCNFSNAFFDPISSIPNEIVQLRNNLIGQQYFLRDALLVQVIEVRHQWVFPKISKINILCFDLTMETPLVLDYNVIRLMLKPHPFYGLKLTTPKILFSQSEESQSGKVGKKIASIVLNQIHSTTRLVELGNFFFNEVISFPTFYKNSDFRLAALLFQIGNIDDILLPSLSLKELTIKFLNLIFIKIAEICVEFPIDFFSKTYISNVEVVPKISRKRERSFKLNY